MVVFRKLWWCLKEISVTTWQFLCLCISLSSTIANRFLIFWQLKAVYLICTSLLQPYGLIFNQNEVNLTYLISNLIFNCLIYCLCKSAAMKIDIDIWKGYFEGNVSPTYSSRLFHVHILTSPDYYKAIHLHRIILTSAKLPL